MGVEREEEGLGGGEVGGGGRTCGEGWKTVGRGRGGETFAPMGPADGSIGPTLLALAKRTLMSDIGSPGVPLELGEEEEGGSGVGGSRVRG